MPGTFSTVIEGFPSPDVIRFTGTGVTGTTVSTTTKEGISTPINLVLGDAYYFEMFLRLAAVTAGAATNGIFMILEVDDTDNGGFYEFISTASLLGNSTLQSRVHANYRMQAQLSGVAIHGTVLALASGTGVVTTIGGQAVSIGALQIGAIKRARVSIAVVRDAANPSFDVVGELRVVRERGRP